MSVRIKFDIDFSLSETSAGSKELGLAPPWSGISDALDDGGTFRRRIAANATDVVIDLNGLTTGRFLAIKTNKTISIKKNSAGGEPWTIRAIGTGATDGVWFCTTDGVTSLYVTNAGAEIAEVTFSFAGTI